MSVCHICVSYILWNSYLLYILSYSSQGNTSTSAMAATSVTAVGSSPIPVETRLVLVRYSIVYNSISVATQVRSNVSGCYSYVYVYYICVLPMHTVRFNEIYTHALYMVSICIVYPLVYYTYKAYVVVSY